MAFKVFFNNKEKEYDAPVSVLDIVGNDKDIVCAYVNHRVRELTYMIDKDAEVVTLTVKDRDAKPIYESSLRFLVAMAMHNIHPHYDIRFAYNISRSIFLQILNPQVTASGYMTRELIAEMNRLVDLDLPLVRQIVSKEEAARIYVEVQKTADVTYFVDYAFKYLSKYCDTFLDDIATAKVAEMRADFYQVDEEKPIQEVEIPEPARVETMDLFAEEAEEKVEEAAPAPVQQVEKTREEPQKVIAVETPKKKTVKVTYVQEELAVAYIPVALDEKQAVLLEQDLLERDPELKKGEAKFYARHCTKGKKYTIAQYKKSLHCAYETARTSMDHLAELLYYRKEKIKNKYVYIPVERE